MQQQSGDHEPSLQQLDTRDFANEILRQEGQGRQTHFTEYNSVIRMVEHLRHRNTGCSKTVATYISTLSLVCRFLSMNPDEIVEYAKQADEDTLQDMFMRLDGHWIQELNSTATRINKWAGFKTFLYSNNVRKVKLLEANIKNYKRTIDYALTRDDCRRIFDACESTGDKLLVSLLIESLQRISTINALTWGDMIPHLDKGEDVFLVWIDPKRTKRNIEHWMPVGKMSSYYMTKRRQELLSQGAMITEDTPLICDSRFRTTMRRVKTDAPGMRVHRLMMRIGVKGRKQGEGYWTRYEKRCHDFRKFGKVEMQRNKINEDVINYLMGHRRDTYTEWADRYDDLLDIYRTAMPRLEQKDALQEIISFARSKGFDLDPKFLTLIRREGDIRTSASSGQGDTSAVGA